jgi:Ni,Fe-hydrogenase maturation factor
VKKIFCFGNEFVKGDSLAKEICDSIKGFDIVRCNSPDELLDERGDIIILDVVQGINDVIVFDDLSRLKEQKLTTLHDFDLSYFLQIMKELKEIDKVTIIGIPQTGDKEDVKEKIKEILGNL